MATKPKSATAALGRRPHELLNAQMIQNFHLVWLDRSIDGSTDYYCTSITKLRQVINTVNTFVDVDECIDFITDIEEKVFMVISEEFRAVISIVQDISQIKYAYVSCQSSISDEQSAKQHSLVKGEFTDITSICEALKRATQDYDRNLICMTFAGTTDELSNPNANHLHQSFMYTHILKEIPLTIDFEQVHFDAFLSYCRGQFTGNDAQLENVDMIEREYHHKQPIWWYTCQSIFYSMLNRALRTMEFDLIVTMGFFVRDLHNHIIALHVEQYGRNKDSKSFIVYRGQGVSVMDFAEMKKTPEGLMSFNNFLSTSLDPAMALALAESNSDDVDLIGVYFEITVNPSITSYSFANVRSVSYYPEEEEILFSMHSVFRIEQVKQMKKNDRLWQVNLILTSDTDPQLQAVTTLMRKETTGPAGWFQLGRLMMKVAQYDKAQEMFQMILDETTDEKEKGDIYYYLGWIKYDQGKYTEAVSSYEKALEIYCQTIPGNHSFLAYCCNNIGLVYDKMGMCSRALSSCKQALEILQKTLALNHPDLAICHNNIGLVYEKIGEYAKALSYYEQVLEIRRRTLPTKHPDLAQSYNNIGEVYRKMGRYAQAFSSYEQALKIEQKILPANHPDLAGTHSNIGGLYQDIGEYPKALSSYKQALEICPKTLSANHPLLATSYNNIGAVYSNMGEHLKALSAYQQSQEMLKKTLPSDHPNLATSYNNIGGIYNDMGEYSKALSFLERAFEIRQRTLSADHPDLAVSYNNIGIVYDHMGEHSKALSSHEHALKI